MRTIAIPKPLIAIDDFDAPTDAFVMNRRLLAASLLSFCVAAATFAADEAPTTAPKAITVGKILEDVGAPPASLSAADTHAFQQKLTQSIAGKTITLDAGRLIQIITEGGGVKLVSFPPEETTEHYVIHRALSHATMVPADEAASKKLGPPDLVTVTGEVASVSAKFDGSKEGDKPVVVVNVTLKDAALTSFKVVPHPKVKKGD